MLSLVFMLLAGHPEDCQVEHKVVQFAVLAKGWYLGSQVQQGMGSEQVATILGCAQARRPSVVVVVRQRILGVNCFNVREVDDLPGHATFSVLAWLANGKGEMLAELVVERLDNLEETFRVNRKLVFPDRLHDMRFAARIRGCNFPIAGHNQVSLIIDGELIATRRFRVQKKGGKQ